MIPLAVPNLTGKEAEYAAQAIARGYIGPGGPFVERFEEAVAKASGRKWAVATITGSAAIHAAARVLGFAGKTVEVPEHAFPAARNVFLQLGCEVVTVAGGVCHDRQMYVGVDGMACLGALRQGVDSPGSAGLAFLDCAPAVGEIVGGNLPAVFSFAANKVATTGMGGAVVGDDSSFHDAIRNIIHQGRGRTGIFNYRMPDLAAAVGCAQMERLDELKAAKRRIWQRYKDAGLPMMERGASRWMATTTRLLVIQRLAELGIEARHECGGTSLPCSTGITEAEQEAVIAACGKF